MGGTLCLRKATPYIKKRGWKPIYRPASTSPSGGGNSDLRPRGGSTIVLALIVSVSLSGCFGPPDSAPPPIRPEASSFDGITADLPGEIEHERDVVTITWKGTVGPSARLTTFGFGQEFTRAVQEHHFTLTPNVGPVQATLTTTGSAGVELLDEEGGPICRAFGTGTITCHGNTPPGFEARARWTLRVLGDTEPSAPREYAARVVLRAGPAAELGDLLSGLDTTVGFAFRPTGHSGFEPTLGVARSGAIFVVAAPTTLRSTDDGATWQDVSPPFNDRVSFDPFLYVDQRTNRVLVDHLTIACTTLSWSDDDGASWTTNPLACGAPIDDHQKIAVGDHPGPVKPYDGTIYLSENTAWAAFGVHAAKALVVSRSLDGGRTWVPSVALTNQESEYRNHGSVMADLTGNVYVPTYLTNTEAPGDVAVLVSHDHGTTWRLVRVAPMATANRGIDPDIAIDSQGNVFLTYAAADGHAYLATSRDHGDTWGAPVRVDPPNVRSVIFPVAIAGAPGRVAVAYLATPDTERDSQNAPPWTRWHLYVAVTDDALTETPVLRTTRVTPEHDPVQLGGLCATGVRCAADGNRNHADFIDAALTPDGRVVVSLVDGCDAVCTKWSHSRRSDVAVAVQEIGPRLV